MNQEHIITWSELNKIFCDLCDVETKLYDEGILKTDSIIYQRNWKKLKEIKPFIDEIAYERADPIYHGDEI